MASSPVAGLAALMALAACLSQPAAAGTIHRRPARHPVSLDVQPAPEIEAQVTGEVAKSRSILEDLNPDNLLASPYLVSAIYYHDGFLNDFPVDRSSAAPERRIIGQISNLVTAECRARFMQLLHEMWAQPNPPGPEPPSQPVAYSKIGGGTRTHRYAIDLFAPEGAPVYAVSRGIVVLADGDWDPANLFSTSSRKGGNAVIVFDPDHNRFYRYCHLSAVQVSAGEVVTANQVVGSVGHTGLNASQPGHGRHLHFETNEYVAGRVRAVDYRRLRTMIRQWRSSSDLGDSRPPNSRTRVRQ
jgi:murein DD-endopeptidase MepM/ murein hydrolase activator NlpD